MAKFYSKKTGGFYADELRAEYEAAGSWPIDAIELSDDHYSAMLKANSAGARIVTGDDGKPVALFPSDVEVSDSKAKAIRAQIADLLKSTDGIMARHRDEKDFATETTLSDAQIKALAEYRQALRDLPESPGFPNRSLPIPPSFIKE